MEAPLIHCQICQDSFTLNRFRFYNCGHGFCESCIDRARSQSASLSQQLKCAVCRAEINETPRPIFITFKASTVTANHSRSNSDLRNEIEQLKLDAKRTSVKVARLNVQKREAEQNLSTTIDRVERLSGQLKQKTAENSRLSDSVETLETMIIRKDHKLAAGNKRISALNSEAAEFKSRLQEVEEDLSAAMVKLTKLRDVWKQGTEQRKLLEWKVSKLQEKVNRKDAALEEEQRQSRDWRLKVSKLRGNLQEAEEDRLTAVAKATKLSNRLKQETQEKKLLNRKASTSIQKKVNRRSSLLDAPDITYLVEDSTIVV